MTIIAKKFVEKGVVQNSMGFKKYINFVQFIVVAKFTIISIKGRNKLDHLMALYVLLELQNQS